MGKPPVCMGAMLMCSFGMAPSSLMPTPGTTLAESKMVATIMDIAPGTNIMPFAMCQSLANPTVAAATATALGVLTPMPCVPVVPAPWAPGSPTVLVGKKPALVMGSQAMCAWGGVISITNPNSTKEMM
ncbi:DUF4280 domain-containing protein [Nakamurella silvestris]|nr:DUF4280 domain-containing protein [Nakamurella silvestris]